jgi:hypothetical protein
LKEEALDRSMRRARFGRGFGPVVRQTTKWTGRSALSVNYGKAGMAAHEAFSARSALDPGPRKALKILIELAGHTRTSGHRYEHLPPNTV